MTQKFEMADRFNPSAVEQALYQHWEEVLCTWGTLSNKP